jgi:hypothetical protein
MAERFLFKTEVLQDSLLVSSLGAGKALEDFERLQAFLDGQVSDAARQMFAEPLVSRKSGADGATVSWYVAWDGDARSLTSLAPEARRAAERLLSAQLAELEPLMGDPVMGKMLEAALTIRSPEDIWVVDGAPVLVNWGILPAGTAQSPEALQAHLATTLGAYAGFAAPAAASAMPTPPVPPASPAPALSSPFAGVSAQGAGQTFANQMSSPMHQNRQPLPLAAWLPPVILIAIFGLLLIWLLLPGNRLFPEPAARLTDDAASVAVLEEGNRALAERARALEEALATAVCTVEGDLVLPSDGRMPDGLLPPAAARDATPEDARASPSSLLPPDPQQIAVPQVLPEIRADGQPVERREITDLLSLIESQTALVLVESGRGSGTGSGFFVGPDLLVTNFHVIESALNGRGEIFVINESLGDLRSAEVIAHDGPLEATGRDFALLRVERASQPFYTLRSSDQTMRLQNVIAAGYPGAILETDNSFAALLSGENEVIPPATVTDGIVNVEQDFGPLSMRVMVHTATISPGNSGGPLVDYCGRVVGINTFGRSAESRQLNFALTSTDLLRFMDEAGAATSANGSACAPVPIGASTEAGLPAPDAVPAPDGGADAAVPPANDAPAQ